MLAWELGRCSSLLLLPSHSSSPDLSTALYQTTFSGLSFLSAPAKGLCRSFYSDSLPHIETFSGSIPRITVSIHWNLWLCHPGNEIDNLHSPSCSPLLIFQYYLQPHIRPHTGTCFLSMLTFLADQAPILPLSPKCPLVSHYPEALSTWEHTGYMGLRFGSQFPHPFMCFFSSSSVLSPAL